MRRRGVGSEAGWGAWGAWPGEVRRRGVGAGRPARAGGGAPGRRPAPRGGGAPTEGGGGTATAVTTQTKSSVGTMNSRWPPSPSPATHGISRRLTSDLPSHH
ncbi:hypothetical protein MUDAN_DOGOELCO_03405 [Lactiplantibacillus mudanjiangensis]|nr:hypothetical protein MUDAN_DOGOELCO_03405 [Lactiplantibacillus mudanjiangensis]